MKITINQFKAVLLTNLIVVGLAACSSTPVPWSSPGASPWESKHSADATSAAPADDTITQAPEMAAPAEALPAEPQAEETPAPAPAEAAEQPMPAAPALAEAPAPAEEQAKSVVSDVNNEQRIMALPASYYAVQVYAASSLKSVEQYKSDKKLDDNMMAVKTDRNGKTIYVLVETYPDRGAAQAAASKVASATGSKPWVRSVAGLQKVVKQ